MALIVLIPCFALFLNVYYMADLYKSVDPIPYVTGKVSRDEYIAKYVPEYPALRYINSNLDGRARILFIYTGKRGYYSNRDYLIDDSMSIMKGLIDRAEGPEDISEGLKKRGITHLLVGYKLFGEWMLNNFSEEKQAVTQTFFKEHMDFLYGGNGFGVSALK